MTEGKKENFRDVTQFTSRQLVSYRVNLSKAHFSSNISEQYSKLQDIIFIH